VDLARADTAWGVERQGRSAIKEPWVRVDVEAVEILFVKIEYGALGGQHCGHDVSSSWSLPDRSI
jgi:hypothetical protein